MPLLSVLTAAIGRRAEYTKQAGESLANQRLPPGWEIEWVVQEDGPDPCLSEICAGFTFARHRANNAQFGIPMTRNLALARARGILVHALDCDDLMLPSGIPV